MLFGDANSAASLLSLSLLVSAVIGVLVLVGLLAFLLVRRCGSFFGMPRIQHPCPTSTRINNAELDLASFEGIHYPSKIQGSHPAENDFQNENANEFEVVFRENEQVASTELQASQRG